MATCASCSTPPPKRRYCGRCLKAAYCSVECQRAHWPAHKVLCAPPSPEDSSGLANLVADLEGSVLALYLTCLRDVALSRSLCPAVNSFVFVPFLPGNPLRRRLVADLALPEDARLYAVHAERARDLSAPSFMPGRLDVVHRSIHADVPVDARIKLRAVPAPAEAGRLVFDGIFPDPERARAYFAGQDVPQERRLLLAIPAADRLCPLVVLPDGSVVVDASRS